MKKVLINVTEKHIKNGLAFEGGSCPVALALIDMGYNKRVGNTLIFNINMIADQFLPRSACRFIRNFDDGKKVKPFSFYYNDKYK